VKAADTSNERINVGVILSCSEMNFLDARIVLDEAALRALDPGADVAAIRAKLDTIPAVCRGGPEAGPIGDLPARGRFRWRVSPVARSFSRRPSTPAARRIPRQASSI
jgi:DUF3037 family protein